MAEGASWRGTNSNSHRSSWRIRMPLKFLGRLKHRFKTGFSWERFLREHDPAYFDTEPNATSHYAPPLWPFSYCPSPAAAAHQEEATGSNPTSEYFDAVDRAEYVAQQQIDNYSQLNRPSFLETVDTRHTYPTYHAPQGVSERGTPTADPATEIFYSGELFPDAMIETNVFSHHSTDVGATSNSQHANESSISLIPGHTSASSSRYDLPPVPEAGQHRSVAQYIVDVGRFLIGSDYRYQNFPSPRGRGVRAVARVVCAFQAGKRLLNIIRVKKRRATCHLSARLQKRIRESESAGPGLGFRGVSMRKGKWVAEKRVSMAGKHKLWLGTFESATEAALAYDAAVFHCASKKKQVENLNFPELQRHLEPSRYGEVLKLCQAGCEKRKEEAKALVKSLAAAHAARASNVQ